MMELLIPPSLVALLPIFLEIFERILDGIGLVGEKMLDRRLKADKRVEIRKMVDEDPSSTSLTVLKGYFSFEEKANKIFSSHLAFIVSIFIANAEVHHKLLSLSGWPLIAMVVTVTSLCTFLFGLANDYYKPEGKYQLPIWRFWTMGLFIAIAGSEIVWHMEEVGSHAPA